MEDWYEGERPKHSRRAVVSYTDKHGVVRLVLRAKKKSGPKPKIKWSVNGLRRPGIKR